MHVCEAKISICNRWELEEFKTTCKLVFNRFWKPLVSSLYFLYKPNQTKQNKTLHLNVSRSEQQQQQQQNISTLKYTFLIQTGLIIFVFCRLNSLFQVEVFEAIQHILTSRAGWKFQGVSTYYFNRKQE